MRHFNSSALPLVFLTLLAALTFWLERASQVTEAHREGRTRHDPDFIVDNFTVRRFDISGSLQYILTANKMIHYADDDSTDVIAPALVYYNGGRTARATAQRAKVSKDGKELILSDDVRLVREATRDAPELVVRTSEMYLYPDDDIARGVAPVTITEGASVIKGQGFEADNRTRIIKLTGRVHGIIYDHKVQTP